MWLARCEPSKDEVLAYLGTGIEHVENWFCEAAWAGDYAEGGFDQTDIVVGTGARLRTEGLVFVSSGATVDRLQWLQTADGVVYVSNSLSCLLAALNASIDPIAEDYREILSTIVGGLNKGRGAHIYCSSGKVNFVHFDNLLWDGESLSNVPKVGGREKLDNFDSYKLFLDNALDVLIKNCRDTRRASPMEPLGTVSSGYDSATCAALAKPHGLNEVITFTKAKRGLDDSGKKGPHGNAHQRVVGE